MLPREKDISEWLADRQAVERAEIEYRIQIYLHRAVDAVYVDMLAELAVYADYGDPYISKVRDWLEKKMEEHRCHPKEVT